ncbi:MAG: hypothetical protein Q8O94_01425 [bacterium]|nr:hypothetical protein [bacterium]
MNMDKKKILLIAVSIAVLLGVVLGYYFIKKTKESTAADVQAAADAAGSISESATQGVLPSIGEAANPLTNKPDINPTSKTNPFQ